MPLSKKTLLLLLLLIPCLMLQGQVKENNKPNPDSLLVQNLESIEITSTVINTTWLKSPMAISLYSASTIQDSKQQLSLQESISNISGLYAINANNYAQDLRIAIRGFGARAAFGVRGIKIVVDGIPETTPDGQGQIDNLSLGNIERIEVIKGAASALYGNAAGGVISINTLSEVERNFVEAGLTFGAFTYNDVPDSLKLSGQGMQQYQLKAGLKTLSTDYVFQGSYVQSDGYRVQSGVESFNVNARMIHQFARKTKLSLQANYTNSPKAEDAGSLNLESVEANRVQARDRNVLFKTGEAISQFKVGANFSHAYKEKNRVEAYGFYSNRAFEGLLPIPNSGWIELNRNYVGHGASYERSHFFMSKEKPYNPKASNRLRVGYEWALQKDDRQRFQNAEGTKGETALNQLESFNNVGLYALNHFSTNRWLVDVGLRYDWNQLKAVDAFLDNGDGSGQLNLSAFNPSIGASYRLFYYGYVYANYRSSFETPSLTELSSNPNEAFGFNDELKAQRANNYEIGFKGNLKKKYAFELTFFHIDTKDELVPYELATVPDRTFYRNAGTTQRDGIELSLQVDFTKKWFVLGSYTFSDFVYKDYVRNAVDFGGKQLPGIPQHFGALSINHKTDKGLNFQVEGRYSGALFTSDTNDISAKEYLLVNGSVSYRWQGKRNLVTPFFGVNNLLNTRYNDNIRINAFGNRFYEPAPELNVYGGIRVRIF